LIAENLDHLPDAMVITAGVDILRDEGVLYARRLQTAAVPIVWKHYPSAIHGTLNLPGKLRQQMLTDIVEYLRSHLR
jgi:acetyl esterase